MVILRDPSGKHPIQVLEQNYRADPISESLLLSLNEGKTIDFLVQRENKQEVGHRQNHPQRIHASQLHGDESEPFFPAGLSVARAPSPAKGRRLIILRREKELRAQLSQPSVTAEEPQNLSAGSSHISIES